jgi:hypothetical protein
VPSVTYVARVLALDTQFLTHNAKPSVVLTQTFNEYEPRSLEHQSELMFVPVALAPEKLYALNRF